MNKHAFTFLTLFTLVLLLSAYYITLPNDTYPKDNLIVSSDGSDSKYLDVLNEQRENQENSNDNIVASSKDFEKKTKALENNSELKKTKNIEKEITEELNKQNLQGCYVELVNDVVRIVAQKKDQNNENVVKIMKIVYDIVEEDKLVEILFE